jgi:tetratricopeptide (TPR) repeat protein
MLAECERLLGESLARFGDSHEETAKATAWLAAAQYERGNFEQAVALRLACVGQVRRLFGPTSKQVVGTLDKTCWPLFALRRWSDAELLIRDAIQLFGELPMTDRFELVDPALTMAAIRVERGELSEAERLIIRSLHHELRSLEHFSKGSFNWTEYMLAVIFNWLSIVYERQGKLQAAERAIRKSLRQIRANCKVSRKHEALALQRLGAIQAAQGNRTDAVASLHEARRIIAGLLPGYQRISDSIDKQLRDIEETSVA